MNSVPERPPPKCSHSMKPTFVGPEFLFIFSILTKLNNNNTNSGRTCTVATYRNVPAENSIRTPVEEPDLSRDSPTCKK